MRLKQDLTGVHLVRTGLIPRPQYPFHSGLGMRLLANVLISVSLLGCRVGDGVLYLWTTSGVCVCVGVGVGVDVCVCVWVWVWVCVCGCVHVGVGVVCVGVCVCGCGCDETPVTLIFLRRLLVRIALW